MVNWDAIADELEQVAAGLAEAEQAPPVLAWAHHPRLYWHHNAFKLWYYPPELPGASEDGPAIVLVYSWVNSPVIMDFDRECSLVQLYRQAGFAVYVLAWHMHSLGESDRVLRYYYERWPKAVIDDVHAYHRQVHLAGVCQGGIFALAYAALHPRDVASLTLMMTPVDSRSSSHVLMSLGSQLNRQLADSCCSQTGWLPGEALQAYFALLKPARQYYGRPIDAAVGRQGARQRRIDAWLGEMADLPVALLRDYIDTFVDGKALESGIRGARHTATLQDLRVPVINVLGRYDRLVLPQSATVLAEKLDPALSYYEYRLGGGHISLFTDRTVLKRAGRYMLACLKAIAG